MMHPVLDIANPFKSSPAPSSAPHISPGESVPAKACGVGELAAAESSPAAASIYQSSDGAGERPRLETDVSGSSESRYPIRSVNAEAGVAPGPSEAYPPAGYVLVPIDELKCWRDDLAYYRAREQQGSREQLPAFLENPSWQYLAAVERGAA